ncbi:MAG: hypothetical protein JWR26_1805 [Pedosphaera sp.]|nr:hypothetical protein [Pedosphaera sp.]
MAQKLLKYIVVVLITVNMVILGFVVLGGKSDPVVPLPNPNGYDDFVKAGKLSPNRENDYKYATMPQDDLRALVVTNEEALKLVRVGLTRKCRVPINYSQDYFERILPELLGFKALTFVLCAEGKLAEQEGRTNDAAKIYMEAIRFGQESSRGGVIMSRLVGMVCELIARKHLQPLANRLDAAQDRGIIETLATVDATEEAPEKTLKQETALIRKVASFKEQFEALIHYKDERAFEADFVAKVQKNRLERRQTMIAFAARAYELEKGKSPGSMSDLVPGYLKAIPQDPTTGTNLVYSPQ